MGSLGHPRPPSVERKLLALDETFIVLEEMFAMASLLAIPRLHLKGASHIGYNRFRLYAYTSWTIARNTGRTVSGPVRSLGAFRQS